MGLLKLLLASLLPHRRSTEKRALMHGPRPDRPHLDRHRHRPNTPSLAGGVNLVVHLPTKLKRTLDASCTVDRTPMIFGRLAAIRLFVLADHHTPDTTTRRCLVRLPLITLTHVLPYTLQAQLVFVCVVLRRGIPRLLRHAVGARCRLVTGLPTFNALMHLLCRCRAGSHSDQQQNSSHVHVAPYSWWHHSCGGRDRSHRTERQGCC